MALQYMNIFSHLLIVFSSQLKVLIHLGLAGKVFELSRVSEGLRDRALVLYGQHFTQAHMHLVEEVDIQLTKERLQWEDM